ncbi:class C sortase [Enterococcus pingfangensis]|uniref:class C sortase n=1 Tax=Enterococcus pingfangensis TaxID=2559924 RepID=UPI0010F8A5ED|nr:class C sortase [Enterococcus pingfangensis]
MKTGGKKKLITRILMLLLFLVGSLTALYPFYSDAVNSLIDQKMVENYQKKADKQRLEQMKKANDSNTEQGTVLADPFEETGETISDSQKYLDKHLIGTLEISSIKAVMPVYDTTNEFLLSRGATVLQGTSYPTGGKNTHAAISAHRGLPQRQLFTDLPKVKEKDIFVLTIAGEKLAYEVDQIKVVEPNEIEDLQVIPESDLVTLITCTPYMINSHRLLVRGYRVPYTEKIASDTKQAVGTRRLYQWAILAGIIGLLVGIAALIYRMFKNYWLRKKTFDLVFYLQDPQGIPLQQHPVLLTDRRGKQVLQRNDAPFIVQSDMEGKVIFEQLPGNVYTVMLAEQKRANAARFRAGFTKLKQTEPSFFLPKRTTLSKKIVSEQVIIQVNQENPTS